MTRPDAAVLVYDGDCAFCQRCIDVASAILPAQFRAEPYQLLPLEELGVTVEQAESAVWWVQPSRPARGGHRAVAGLLQAQPRWWWRAAGWLIERPPVSAPAAWVYAVVARNRHRLPGGTAQCRVPRTALRAAAPGPTDNFQDSGSMHDAPTPPDGLLRDHFPSPPPGWSGGAASRPLPTRGISARIR